MKKRNETVFTVADIVRLLAIGAVMKRQDLALAQKEKAMRHILRCKVPARIVGAGRKTLSALRQMTLDDAIERGLRSGSRKRTKKQRPWGQTI